MKYTTREIGLHELKDIYNRIKADFADGEYPPYPILYHQLKTGVQRGFFLLEDGREAAYAVLAEGAGKEYILISLFAVYQEYRGQGIGSAFLEELKKIYEDKMGLIVEVEKPADAKSDQEKDTRERRIQFYRKAGFYLIPDVEYSIWDIPMHLMALPQRASAAIINKTIDRIISEIYSRIMDKRFIHKMQIIIQRQK